MACGMETRRVSNNGVMIFIGFELSSRGFDGTLGRELHLYILTSFPPAALQVNHKPTRFDSQLLDFPFKFLFLKVQAVKAILLHFYVLFSRIQLALKQEDSNHHRNLRLHPEEDHANLECRSFLFSIEKD
jgi:hypothetical protein